MSKIQTNKFKNFKAIKELEMDFKGCTAIVTGANDKGKTSFLRGMIDRLRFLRPDVIVKSGETEGSGEMVLDTGEKFAWVFKTDGTDKLTYVTKEGSKTNVTKELAARFVSKNFDIDKFLNSSPQEQTKQLQAIVGIDFTDVDKRYLEAYNLRKVRNEESERYHVKLSKMLACEKVVSVSNVEILARKEHERKRLNDLYLSNKEKNDATKKLNADENIRIQKEWADACKAIDKSVIEHNETQTKNRLIFNAVSDSIFVIYKAGFKEFAKNSGYSDILDKFQEVHKNNILDDKNASKLYAKQPEAIPMPELITPELPTDEAVQAIDKELLDAAETNRKAKEYLDYITLKNEVAAALELALEADKAVKEIEQERAAIISKANFPKGIEMKGGEFLIDGLPFNNTQTSSSRKYITALKIGAIQLGEIRTQYFDASYLDKNSLAEIECWAEENDLQLLIERPDYDGGEIKYELIEN